MEEAVKAVADKSVIVDVEKLTKDTAEEAQLSVVSAANSVTETVNPSGKGVGNAVKDTAEEAKPSVIGVEDAAKATVEEVKPSDNHNGKLYEEQLVGGNLRNASQEHLQLSNDVKEPALQRLQYSQESKNLKEIDIKAIEYKTIQHRQEEFKRHQQETPQKLKQKRNKFRTENIQKITGILLGAATISLIGVVWGFTSRQNLLATKSPTSNLATKPTQLATKSPTSNLATKSTQLATNHQHLISQQNPLN
jgi:hypothetical protein